MYKLVAIAGILIRQFCLPNPFECFGSSAELINLVAGGVLGMISYYLVGLIYEKGSAPVLGSILYSFVYTALTGALWLMGIFSFKWWWILTLIACCSLLLRGIKMLVKVIEKKKVK